MLVIEHIFDLIEKILWWDGEGQKDMRYFEIMHFYSMLHVFHNILSPKFKNGLLFLEVFFLLFELPS